MSIPYGPIRFSDLRNEFNGGFPIRLSQYYRGSGLVNIGQTSPSGTIPTSGTIRLSTFRGATGTPLNIVANTGSGSMSGIASAGFYVARNGLIVQNIGTGFATRSWYVPTTTTIGDAYWCRLVRTGGTMTFLGGSPHALNTWYPITQDRAFSTTYAGSSGVATMTCTLQISNNGGSTIVSSSDVGGFQYFITQDSSGGGSDGGGDGGGGGGGE
jgi:hypothetical protein